MRLAIAVALLLAACGQPGPADGNATSDDLVKADPTPTGQPQPQPENAATPAKPAGQKVSACLVQGGQRVPENALHAIGTEPFWAADVMGRCVTYSTPENQAGVRIWTKFEGTSENGRWLGALDGKPFEMATEPQPGCSDGMSDNRYPIKVTLAVRGEQRTGCAEPR